MNELHTARHAAPEHAAELELLNGLGARCTSMADRLTGWLADAQLIEMLARGYGTGSKNIRYPEGAEALSEVLNTIRNTRDALRDAALVMTDD